MLASMPGRPLRSGMSVCVMPVTSRADAPMIAMSAVSPLAPKHVPDMPEIAGVRLATARPASV